MTEAHVEDAARKRPLVYDQAGDAHYDFTSAFIKSMRGSDPDAAVYYLAAMLESGEDARFVARRMIVLASEDVGNADPRALLVAVAAAQAVEHVGLPEARLNLAQAAIYLARAPKSNASYVAINEATADVREHGTFAAAESDPRRQLLRPQARPRRGLHLSARRPARVRDRVPPGGAARPHVLPPVRERRGDRGLAGRERRFEHARRIGAVHGEDDAAKRRRLEGACLADHEPRAFVEREPADAGAERGERKRLAAELVRERETRARGAATRSASVARSCPITAPWIT